VLSGFLITGIFLDAPPESRPFLYFYARRGSGRSKRLMVGHGPLFLASWFDDDLSFAIVQVSWVILERPFLRLKKLFGE
jgi:peptidoglycan/LPS O-acetylase OafA/YrhL